MRERDESPRTESGVHHLAALLRHEATEAVQDDRDQRAWQRLLRAACRDDERLVRKPRLRPLWLVVPVAACVALVAIGVVHFFSNSPRLHFQVDGHEAADTYLLSEVGRPRRVDFSDGSNLVLHPLARLRIANSDADGANLSLERGQLDLAIHHGPSSRWQLEVGPYVVRVTGTRFNVTWDPEMGDVGVDLLDGAVNIRGPGIAEPIVLQVGQQFRANKIGGYTIQARPQTTALPSAVSDLPARDTVAAALKTKRSASAALSAHLAGTPGQERVECDWLGLVSNGQFEATLSHARLYGIDAALSDCPPRSLFALADAARYVGDFDLSRKTLVILRKRSPEDSSKAAFFLGRLEEARGNSKLALSWYTQAMKGNLESHFLVEAKAGSARIAKRLESAPGQTANDEP